MTAIEQFREAVAQSEPCPCCACRLVEVTEDGLMCPNCLHDLSKPIGLSKHSEAIRWLSNILAVRSAQSASITIKSRVFATAGLKFKCADGPWCDSLAEAILAHKHKTLQGEHGE